MNEKYILEIEREKNDHKNMNITKCEVIIKAILATIKYKLEILRLKTGKYEISSAKDMYKVVQKKIAQSLMHRHFATM